MQGLRNALVGAALGALAGLTLLIFGLVRALFHMLLGQRLNPLTYADLRLAAFYLVGFALAGALLGVVRVHQRGRLVLGAGYAMAGVIVMLAIAAADQGLGSMDRVDWIAIPAMGVLFGLAAAAGLHWRKPGTP